MSLVTGMSSDGKGIVRHDGLVTFIPFTAPGDIIRYHVKEKKKNYALGRYDEVVTPSQNRVEPKCPYFGTCGGCQLQHITYQEQLAQKRIWIQDALKRIGGLEVEVSPIVPAHLQWSYRRRICLVLRPSDNGFSAGYIATDNHTLVSINQCPIFTPTDVPIFPAVLALCSSLHPSGKEEGRATILKRDADGFILHFHFKKMPANLKDVVEEKMQQYPFISGIVATSPRKALYFGITESKIDTDGLNIRVSPKAFIQSHPEQSLNIYKAIEMHASGVKTALDLYCGVGIASLFMARNGVEVTGVESNAEAIRLAIDNGKNNRIGNAVFIKADVAEEITQLLKKKDLGLVVANPPREGIARTVLDALVAHPVDTLIYVSCMPSTLARDLKILCQNSYILDSIVGYDMFPQTVHVETLAVLKKNQKQASRAIVRS